MNMKMFRVRFDEMVRIEGVEVVSTRIGCDGRRVVKPEDHPSAARIMTLSEAEAYVSWAGFSDHARSVEIDGDGEGECLQISWHEDFTRSVTVELAC